MNMFLVIMKVKYGAIYTDGSSLCGYHIIKISSYQYNFQSDLSIGGQVISSSEMICDGTCSFPININSCYYILQKNKSINTIVSLRTIINGNGNILCYDLKDILPPCSRSISQNYYNAM